MIGGTRTKYRLDISEAMLGAARLRETYQEIKRIDWAKDYDTYYKFTPAQQRKMLRRMEQAVPLKQMTYEQAKLFHRLKGRIK